MKGKFKAFLIGAAAVIMTPVCVHAITGAKTLDVIYNNIKLMVNGREAVLTDSAGNVHEPFIYNGVVYAPLEATVNAVTEDTGLLPMEWNRETSVYYIGEKVNSNGIVKIQDLTNFGQEPAGISNEDGKRTITIRGKTITPYDIASVSGVNWSETNRNNIALDGKYSRITGKLATRNGSPRTSLIVIGDGVELARYDYTGNEPIEVDVSLVGIKTLRLRGYNDFPGVFYDVQLEKIGQATD